MYRLIPKSRPNAVRTAGAVWAITILVGSAKASKTGCCVLRPLSAFTGQTDTHCPQYERYFRPYPVQKLIKYGALNPRFAAVKAPTVCCIVLHMVSQRRHMTHLFMFRTMEGERSIVNVDISPLYRISQFLSHVRSFVTRNVRCCYMSDIPPDDSDQLHHRPTGIHHPGYVSVRPYLPYIPSYRMGARFLRPSISTTQIRQAPGLFS